MVLLYQWLWEYSYKVKSLLGSNVFKMSARSVSGRVYSTDTSASHEYLCTMLQNGHEFCKLLNFKLIIEFDNNDYDLQGQFFKQLIFLRSKHKCKIPNSR